jgi:hypothetical protein
LIAFKTYSKLKKRELIMQVKVELEDGNCCEYCGERLTAYDTITIRDGNVYHTECLSENLK